MSKLDSLVDKIAEALLPKIRIIIREELDYKLKNSNVTQQSSPQPSGGGRGGDRKPDFSQVEKHLKMENHMFDGSENVIVDENNNTIDTQELIKTNPKAQEVASRIASKDYSGLID